MNGLDRQDTNWPGLIERGFGLLWIRRTLSGKEEMNYWRYSPTSAGREKLIMSKSWRAIAS